LPHNCMYQVTGKKSRKMALNIKKLRQLYGSLVANNNSMTHTRTPRDIKNFFFFYELVKRMERVRSTIK